MARTRFVTSNVMYGVKVANACNRRYSKVKESIAKRVIVPAAKPSYYTKCWGKLIPITPMEAARLRPTGNVIIR